MAQTLDELRRHFQAPPDASRPMLRWWWFGPTIEPAEVDRQLQAMADAGLGGVEVAYVYPLAPATCDFGSDRFYELLRHAAERCQALGLRFDLTLGSGWSFGGPHITQDLAARRLHWEMREIPPGAMDVPGATGWPGEELIAAYLYPGSIHDRAPNAEMLPVADGRIHIPDGSGPRTLLVATARLTGQNVKRAAAGAEGLVFDHYSTAASQAHLEHVADPLVQAVPPALLGSVFCDSLEVYGADWTANVVTEFGQRRGYDLLPVLPGLFVETADSAQVRADYYRTLSELYQENFVAVVRDWAAGHGVPFRIQSYGVPPATVSSYRYADIAEGEGWGWTGLPQVRWASSGAHLYSRDIVSSEVWTWVHSPSFRATPLDLQAEAHEHMLCGVNHLIGHGWPYSPANAAGLGWFFYAAGALDDRNPWWSSAMRPLAKHLQRLCWLLRQGIPVADVKVYVPAQDIYPAIGPSTGGSLNLWQGTADHLGPDLVRVLRTGGWDFDLIDDEAMTTVDPATVPVVVLPFTTSVPAATAAWLDRVRAAGGTVLAVGSAPAGMSAIKVEELPDMLADAVPADVAVGADSVGVVHRRVGDNLDVYFVANTGNVPQTSKLTPRTVRRAYEQWDPTSGELITSGTGSAIDLTLHPYEATVLVTFDENVPTTRAPLTKESRQQLATGWQVSFGGDTKPVQLPHRWEDDPDRAAYSGSATYECEFDLDSSDERVFLDFGDCEPIDAADRAAKGIRGRSFRVEVRPPVGEVVQVQVNGNDAGVLFSAPYRIELSPHVRLGRNQLRLVVSNTAANALTVETEIDRLARASENQYGRRFIMQDLDRAGDDLRSGLLGVPALVQYSHR